METNPSNEQKNVRNYTFTNCTNVTINASEEGKAVDVMIKKEENRNASLQMIAPLIQVVSETMASFKQSNRPSAPEPTATVWPKKKNARKTTKKKRPSTKKRSARGKKK